MTNKILVVDPHIPGFSELKDACQDDVIFITYVEPLPFDNSSESLVESEPTPTDLKELCKDATNVGFVWANPNRQSIPFSGFEEMLHDNLVVDLITCDLGKDDFPERMQALEAQYTNLQIRYSLDKTANPEQGGDWIMESHNVSVKPVFFTDKLSLYTYSLDPFILKVQYLSSGVTLRIMSDGDNIAYSERWFDYENGAGLVRFNTPPNTNAWDLNVFDTTGTNYNDTAIAFKKVEFIGTVNWPFDWQIYMNNAVGNFELEISGLPGNIINIVDSGNTKTVEPDYTGASYFGMICNGNVGDGTGGTVTGLNVVCDKVGTKGGGIINRLANYNQSTHIFKIENCSFTGNVGSEAGGICGYIPGYSSVAGVEVSGCIVTGDVTGNYAGGICANYAGHLNNGLCKITNCSFEGNITGAQAGGICGATAGQTGSCVITNCDVSGNITADVTGQAGGICGYRAGYSSGSCVVSQCSVIGNVSSDKAGGICGAFAGKTGSCVVSECSVKGTVTGNDAGGICGAFAGDAGECVVSECSVIGDVTGMTAGGICGTLAGDAGSCVVSQCSVIGNVTSGADSAGGICSMVAGGSSSGSCVISQCSVIGNVTANNAGGICGNQISSRCQITNCYLDGPTNVVGDLTISAIIENCWFQIAGVNGSGKYYNITLLGGLEKLNDERPDVYLSGTSATLVESGNTLYQIYLDNTVHPNNNDAFAISNRGTSSVADDAIMVKSRIANGEEVTIEITDTFSITGTPKLYQQLTMAGQFIGMYDEEPLASPYVWKTNTVQKVFSRISAVTLNSNEHNLYSAVTDGTFGYFGTWTSPARIVKVQLSNMTRVDAVTLNSNENQLRSAVTDGTFGYFGTGTYNAPGRVIKVQLSDMTRVDARTLETGENVLCSAVTDGTFGYFGTDTSPGRVVKVNLSTMLRVNALTLETGENKLRCAVTDGTYGYFGTNTSPRGFVIKVRLSDMTRVDNALMMNTNEKYLLCAVTDGTFGYFGTSAYGVTARVVKVKLSDMSHRGYEMLDTDEERLWSAVTDGTYGYFGTYTTPARVIKFHLGNMQRVGAVTLDSGEDDLWSAIIANGYGYFGTGTMPGRVVKIYTGEGATYTLDASDEPDKVIECSITATMPSASTLDISKTIIVSNDPPVIDSITITGLRYLGQTLTCVATATDLEDVPEPNLTYQWQRDWSSIGAATSATYTLIPIDIEGSILNCVVTATDSYGTVVDTSANITVISDARTFNLTYSGANVLVIEKGPGNNDNVKMTLGSLIDLNPLIHNINCSGVEFQGDVNWPNNWTLVMDGAAVNNGLVIEGEADKTITICKSYIDPTAYLDELYKGMIRNGNNGTGRGGTIRGLNVVCSKIGSQGGGIVDRYANQSQATHIFKIENCSFTGNVDSEAGGICGYIPGYQSAAGVEVSGCSVTGNITGTYAGGICANFAGFGPVGGIAGLCKITNCSFEGNVTADFAGGICGANAGKTGSCVITNCDVSGNIGASQAGGICGRYAGINGKCLVSQCSVIGNVNTSFGGGICAGDAGDAGSCVVSQCSVIGNITVNFAGGICGRHAGGSSSGSCVISQCSVTGTVSNELTDTGGICGKLISSRCQITNCYLDGPTNVIGSGSATITKCWFQIAGDDGSGKYYNITLLGGLEKLNDERPYVYLDGTAATLVSSGTSTIYPNYEDNTIAPGIDIFAISDRGTPDATGGETTDTDDAIMVKSFIADNEIFKIAIKFNLTYISTNSSSLVIEKDPGNSNNVKMTLNNGLVDLNSSYSADPPLIHNIDCSGVEFKGEVNWPYNWTLVMDGAATNEDLIIEGEAGNKITICESYIDPTAHTGADYVGMIRNGINGGNTGRGGTIRGLNVECDEVGTRGGGIVEQYANYNNQSVNVFKIEDCSFEGNVGSEAGGICGYIPGYNSAAGVEVSGCIVTGDVTGNKAGGICANFAGNGIANYPGSCKITDCSFVGNVTGDNAGGICGATAGKTGSCVVSQCSLIGDISGDETGGICGSDAGYDGSCNISGCSVEGDVKGENAGGICGSHAGQNNGECVITQCSLIGDISGNGTGGICGYRAGYDGSCNISGCSVEGDVKGENAGGICGSHAGQNNGSCVVSQCSLIGDISGNGTGGICGYSAGYDGSCNISGCSVEGDVKGENAGGICGYFAGYNGSCVITKCDVSGNISAEQAGGICGNYAGTHNGKCLVSQCSLIGNVDCSFGGGICGANAGGGSVSNPDVDAGSCVVSQCSVIGNVTANNAGGICGYRAGGKIGGVGSCVISQCSVKGTVSSGLVMPGGICGNDITSRCHITNCYLDGPTNVIGSGGATIAKCWFKASSGTTDAAETNITLPSGLKKLNDDRPVVYIGGTGLATLSGSAVYPNYIENTIAPGIDTFAISDRGTTEGTDPDPTDDDAIMVKSRIAIGEEVTIVITGTFSISGTPQLNQPLTIENLFNGMYDEVPDLTYEWTNESDDSTLSTNNSYTLITTDNPGDIIKCTIIATMPSASLFTVEKTVDVSNVLAVPVITRAAGKLTCGVSPTVLDNLNAFNLTYQWFFNNTNIISGATSPEYTLIINDISGTLKCEVRASVVVGSNAQYVENTSVPMTINSDEHTFNLTYDSNASQLVIEKNTNNNNYVKMTLGGVPVNFYPTTHTIFCSSVNLSDDVIWPNYWILTMNKNVANNIRALIEALQDRIVVLELEHAS